jgi:ankyrin repeat protein
LIRSRRHSPVLRVAAAVAALATPSLGAVPQGSAQTPPGASEVEAYRGLLAAAAAGDLPGIERLIASKADPNQRDDHGRTPLLVAAHRGQHAAARALLKAGADPNALDVRRYDLLTIAAVRNDVAMIEVGLAGGANPANVTSPYDGTALIAAAHLGHVEVVRRLIAARAPLDHVNNLGWTALIEAIVLGDGGARHTEVLDLLVRAGANVNLPDRSGVAPLALARQRGYQRMAALLERVGARP